MPTVFWAWIFMILGFCITSTRSQVFDISRSTSGVDTFKIPSAVCSDSRIGCSSFSASGSSCSCSCTATHSTFTFVNNRWQCMANAGARNHFQRGCGATTTFSGERQNGRIPTLVVGGRREIALHWANFQSIVTCSLDLRSSWFTGCNGSQRLLTNEHYNAAVMMFSISKRFASSRYILQVKTGVPNSNLLQGRVINVVMDCAARWFGTDVVSVESCLVFKLAGTETCPVNRPTNSSSSSTYVASFTASLLETHSTIIQSSTSALTTLVTSLYTSIAPSTTSVTSSMIPKTSPTISMRLRTSFVSTSRAPLSSLTASNITLNAFSISPTISVNSASVSEFTSRFSLSSPRTTDIIMKASSISSSFSSQTSSYSTPQSVTSLISSSVSPKTTFIGLSTVPNVTPKASSSLTTVSHLAPRASDSMLSQTSPYLRSWETLSSPTATFEVTQTASEVTPKASVISSTAFEVTPKVSLISSTASKVTPKAPVVSSRASDFTLRPSVSLPRSRDATLRTSVSSPTVSDTTLVGFVISSTLSDTTPRISVSSPTAFSRRTTDGILPAPSNVPQTVEVLPEVIEVSKKLKEAQETPFVIPPTEPAVQPTSFERNIPPTVSGGRKGNISQLYVGLIAGIVAAVIVLVIVVVLLVYRRRYSRKPIWPVATHTFRVRSSSEETKISVMMSPRTNSACERDENDSDSNTLRRSSMYVPNYRIPLWEDETDNSRVYAVIHFPEGTNGGATDGEEPFYDVLEGPDLEEQFTGDEENAQNDGIIRINDDVFQIIEDPSAGPAAYDNHIYAEVRRPKRRSAIKPKRSSEHSKCRNEPLQEVLEPYIKGTDESEQQEAPSVENAIYFTLEKCFSDSFKGASNDPESKNEPACKVSEGPDQYKAICTEALVFCTKRSGSKKSNSNINNETKFTIEQVFDDLEARYLKGTGEPGNCSTEKPGVSAQRYSLKEARDDSKRANESVYNFLEEVCRKGIPNYGAVSKGEGPVYFTLRRLKSNHSKATRIRPRCANESGSKKLDERFLKGTEENGNNGDPSLEKPVYFTLESCCSDSLKRDIKDSTGANEPERYFLEERYLKGAEDSGQNNSSEKSVFHTLETFYSNSFKKPNSESQC